MSSELLGVVLCGGESRRMGRDKGLLIKDGRPWALYMADKLRPWKLPVIFSINPRQQETYAGILVSERWVVDAVGLAGPLEGLFSVHQKFPHHDLLLLSCDMLDLDEITLATLLDTYRERKGDYDFVVYGEEPFCGIYPAAGLQAQYSSYLESAAPDLSLRGLLKKARTLRLPIADAEAFRNYNS